MLPLRAGWQTDRIEECWSMYATMPEDELKPLLEREEGLRNDWDDTYGDRMQKIVFIGQNMDKTTIKEQLDMCLTD